MTDICRAFDLFEIVITVFGILALIPLCVYSFKLGYKQNDWILYTLGGILGTLIFFAYLYIRSMFC